MFNVSTFGHTAHIKLFATIVNSCNFKFAIFAYYMYIEFKERRMKPAGIKVKTYF